MSNDLPIKKVPEVNPEIAKMLGIGSANELHPAEIPHSSVGDLPISNLPIAEPSHSAPETAKASEAVHSEAGDDSADEKPKANKAIVIAKAVLPYVIIFIVGLFLYYFFFTGVNFGSLFKTQTKVETPKETALSQLESQNMASYTAWINGFYYEVTDPKIIDPDTDNSGNGLSNFQKYILNLNPKSYDTLGLGMPDSESLAQGIDPLTGDKLTDAQKAVVDKYIDLEVVMNRLTLANLQSPHPEVAGTSTNTINSGTTISPVTPTPVTPVSPQPAPAPLVAPQTGANVNPITDNFLSFNTDIAGRLEIPSLNINVPIIWSKDTNSFENDLQAGVIHYPGTAMPGQIGTTYIAGHSSNYIWAKGSYNQIFSKLGDLADNTSFKITVVQTNGKDAIFHYVVTGRKEFLPTDQEQFQNTGSSIVALSTCWPVNSTAKRLVVFGQLTQVED